MKISTPAEARPGVPRPTLVICADVVQYEQKNNNARRSHYAHNDQNLGQNLAHAI